MCASQAGSNSHAQVLSSLRARPRLRGAGPLLPAGAIGSSMLSPNPPSLCLFHSLVSNFPNSYCSHQRMPLGMGRLAVLTGSTLLHTPQSQPPSEGNTGPPRCARGESLEPQSPNPPLLPTGRPGPLHTPAIYNVWGALAPEVKAAGARAQRCALRPVRGCVTRDLCPRLGTLVSTWRTMNLLQGGYF